MSRKRSDDKVVVFERGGADGVPALVFAINLHPTESFTDYAIGAPEEGEWRIVLCTDDDAFGGHGRVDTATTHHASDAGFGGYDGRPARMSLYLPSRCGVVLAKVA